ncbi:NACHT domain-containing protein [Aphanizomenon flos-aquae NRERC-008]|uniref:NACHT domain-containing protein n=1 Tax=Aphanizomenon flos-aquae FACHB-1249 TaxID=2692889 RepID=A0ABR8IXM5_APHFL|nr:MULTISPECIES: NACHT domain-containing protein [Aphanizomenon]MBD2389908.1 NACHT domain-containing protein [Aphanizomenon flos-aquae FACHB-1171]MBD2558184.1 NACHT domain-containing protein [Aphanizomenon flos-aquae FACHB-1290]MBD2633667.1 NACHT domain-containing protein [Aphanizomenon sp. FACHB-1399]MBD2644601.1 NACHT domain-containing protein [Aphanizomenon sp. FACHB-1401]MBD2658959.1 NACHT domain-containing protein [Aphanizomenon flos-aquae FACHB-1265]
MTGFEPFLASAVSGVAVPIFQSLWGSGGKVLGMFGKSLDRNTKQLIFNASKQYEQNYEEKHGILKVLGMREPVKLESVYTAVQFLNDDAIGDFLSIQDLEKVYRQGNARKFNSQDSQKQLGIEVANKKQYLMVLGGPGAGKSTFLRKMGLEALKVKKGGFKHSCIPVFIELKGFTSSGINIEKFIIEEFRICNFPDPEKFTAKALEKGKLLILLDGLDEVPSQNLNETINQIQNFVDKYDQNRFIASCRTAAYRGNFRRFSDVAMADFDDEQIQQFINNWFQKEEDKQAKTGDKCWELLQKPENQAAKELAHTPLLLTFLCLVYDRSQNFPNNRSVLYKNALRILLEEWAAEKRILRDEIYQGLHTELEEVLLSKIAYTGFASNRLFFSQSEIVDQIKTFLAGNLNAPQHLNGEAVLNAIAIQQGILVERARDVFSFSHLTLQEYLTAQHIYDNRLVEKLVTEHLTDKRWKEVFLLVAGVMRGGADDLLLLMEKELQKYINTPKLQALLNWAEEVTVGSPGDYKPVGKRAVAIANANAIANTYTNAIAIADSYVNTKIDYIVNAMNNAHSFICTYQYARPNAYIKGINYFGEIEKLQIFNQKLNFTLLLAQLQTLKAKIPDDKQPEEVHLAFAKKFIETLLNGFNLTPEMVNLSEEEFNDLDKYLYANYLIIQCKEAALSVSKQIWETIETRMLLVKNN